jgi:hypothetical protein
LNNIYEIIGAVHLHSNYSDGTWDIPSIAQRADEVGLDFLLFTDHHTLQPKKDGWEGFYGRTLVLIGYETSDFNDHNHYLAFQLREVVPGITAEQYVTEIAKRGGWGIIAHPMEKRNKLEHYPPYPWTEWNCNSFNGIEIWNQLSEWMERLTKYNKLYRILHPLKTTISPTEDTLRKWDELAGERKMVGTAGIDAHSFEVKVLRLIKLKIFHYKVMLKSLRNHLLLKETFPRGDVARCEEAIFTCLREGRLFFSNHRRGDAQGFRFWAENEREKVLIGETISGKETWLRAESPLKAELSLIHNGRMIFRTKGNRLEYKTTENGIYRVEARRKGYAWVYTNHIYMKDIDKGRDY